MHATGHSTAVVEGRAQYSAASIEELIAQRNAARAAKNFSESDRIRDELKAQGVTLEDKLGGKTEWRRT